MDERDARSWCCSPYPNRYITKRHVNMMRVDQVKDGGKKLAWVLDWISVAMGSVWVGFSVV